MKTLNQYATRGEGEGEGEGVPPRNASSRGAYRTQAWKLLLKIVSKRLVLGLASLLAVSFIIFGSVALLPGSYADAIMGQAATPEAVAALEEELGLDRPAYERYILWMTGVLQGDFGASLTSTPNNIRHVTDIVGPRVYNTLILTAITALIAVPIAISVGILSACLRNGWLDRILNGATLSLISSPEFFLGYLLTYVVIMQDGFAYTPFAQALPDWLSVTISKLFSFVPNAPVISSIRSDMSFGEWLWVSLLPIATLALVIGAYIMRMTRSAIINVMSMPYIEMAKLKGVHPVSVVLSHALPNAWAPIAYVVALCLAYLITGAVVVEVIFIYPGVGQLMVDAVTSRDLPVVQACALIFATAYIVINLLVDLVAIFTNPKLVYPK